MSAVQVASNVGQHVRSHFLLTPPSKRTKVLAVRDATADIALRYVQVQEAFFPKVRVLALATAGIRVATKDVQYVALGGRADLQHGHHSGFRVAWDTMAPRAFKGSLATTKIGNIIHMSYRVTLTAGVFFARQAAKNWDWGCRALASVLPTYKKSHINKITYKIIGASEN